MDQTQLDDNNEQQVPSHEQFEELVGRYVEYKDKENYYKSLSKEMTDEVDQLLHKIGQNSMKVHISALNKTYEAKYIDRTTKKVDYVKLSELLSESVYDLVVQENTTTYLQIKSSATNKKSTKREKPIKEEENPINNIPKGVFK